MSAIRDLLAAHEYKYGRPQGGESAAGALASLFQQQAALQQAKQLEQEKLAQLERQKKADFERSIQLELAKMGEDPAAQDPVAPAIPQVNPIQERNQLLESIGEEDPLDRDRTEAGRVGRIIKKETEGSAYGDRPIKRDMRPISRNADPLSRLAEAKRRKLQEPTIEEKKFAVKQEEEAKLQELQSESVKAKASDMLTSVDRLLGDENLDRFGLTGPLYAIPGTGKREWLAELNYLKGNQVLQLMNDLKQASKTGATGFGQLTEKELALLQGSANRLEAGLPREAAKKELQRIKSLVTKVIESNDNSEPQRVGRFLVEVE